MTLQVPFICTSVILLLATSIANAGVVSPAAHHKGESKHVQHAHQQGPQNAHSHESKNARFNEQQSGHLSKKDDKQGSQSSNQKEQPSPHSKEKKDRRGSHSAHPLSAHLNKKKAKDWLHHHRKRIAHLKKKHAAHLKKKHAKGAHQRGPKSTHNKSQNIHDKKKNATHSSHSEKHHVLQETCEELINHGTHFTVELQVGTPSQKFAVVADTGSDAILIPSCQCVEDMYCSNESRCFMGTNKSSTFSYRKDPKGEPKNNIKMMFGSGPVEAVVASDKVRVGNVQVMMKDAVLLMTDHMLNIKGPFEGILGLGLPASSVKKGLYKTYDRRATARSTKLKSVKVDSMDRHRPSKHWQSLDVPKKSQYQRQVKDRTERDNPIVDYSPMMNIALPDRVVQVEPSASLIQIKRPLHKKGHVTSDAHEDTEELNSVNHTSNGSNESTSIIVKGFAETAGIDRFSMCFNDGAPGVLRLQSKKADLAHGSVGQVHWGLDFRGISVGKKQMDVEICHKMSGKNQTTPCGAIPDSGTTALMGPKDHIIALYESICDEWDRCKKNHTAFLKAREEAHKAAVKEYNVDPFELQNATKGMIFQMLLMDCQSWWVEGTGLDELPDLDFHVRGVNETKQTLKLHGWSYVIETYEKDFTTIYRDVKGVGTMPVGRNFTGGSHKVCSPAFSTMDYQTEKNGPVWILGTPVFYEYQVGYDYKTSPPTMSFDDTECGTCHREKKKTSLTAVGSQSGQHSSSGLSRGRRPRQVLGNFRTPSLDTSRPL